MTNLKRLRLRHASVCILQQLFIFGGDVCATGGPVEWGTSVEYLNIELEHGVWQSAPPMPSALEYPQIASCDTNVYLMGDHKPVLYLFDVLTKMWSKKTSMPRNPRRGFSIAAGKKNICYSGMYIPKICVSMDVCWWCIQSVLIMYIYIYVCVQPKWYLWCHVPSHEVCTSGTCYQYTLKNKKTK